MRRDGAGSAGCFSAGDTLAEALTATEEAIALHVEGLIEAGEPVPAPAGAVDPDGGIVAAVRLDDGLLSERAVRVNVSLPSRLLAAMDRVAGRRGRSSLLVTAVASHLRHGRRNSE